MAQFSTIECGIQKSNSKTAKNPYRINDRNSSRYFETYREAKVNRCVNLAIKSLLQKRYNALSSEEKRMQNVQTYGNTSNMERQIAIEIKTVLEKRGITVIILNDGTRADILIQRPDGLFIPCQLKTTNSCMKRQENTWKFQHVLGYSGMPVICYRNDKKNGWVFDGKVLDDRKIDDIMITPGGKNEALAMHNGTIEQICEFLLESQDKFDKIDQVSASWDFQGNAMTMFKERVSLDLYIRYYDPNATFPINQNGSYDLDSQEQRLQFKLACRMANKNGLHATLHKSAGRIDGKTTYKPYSSGDFDALVVMYIDWTNNKVHIWKIPEQILLDKQCLKTEECEGKQSFYVYIPDESQRKHTSWTCEYYIGVKDVPQNFGPEAETTAARFFVKCRNALFALESELDEEI